MKDTRNRDKANRADHDSIPTRESLLVRLKDWQDDRSWSDFFETYNRLIYAVAVRAGLSESEAKEALQETFVSVAKEIKGFQLNPEGSFRAWLMVITRRRIADQFRRRPKLIKRAADRTPSDRTSTLERIPDPAGSGLEAVWEEEWKQNLFNLAVQNAKEKSGSKDYFLFQQQVIKGRSPQQAAKELGVSLAYAYVAKYRVSRLIKKEIRSLSENITKFEKAQTETGRTVPRLRPQTDR
jgi:RNA polymerase sigma factor (sigma-70 family)